LTRSQPTTKESTSLSTRRNFLRTMTWNPEMHLLSNEALVCFLSNVLAMQHGVHRLMWGGISSAYSASSEEQSSSFQSTYCTLRITLRAYKSVLIREPLPSAFLPVGAGCCFDQPLVCASPVTILFQASSTMIEIPVDSLMY
jgi:hypothetical protein